jgi:hypothetical protein
MHSILPRFVSQLLTGAGHTALYGPALDTITVQGTAIGATLAAGTVASGDSLQVKSLNGSSKAYLLQVWQDNQVAGIGRLRTPKWHDNIDGFRYRVQIGVIEPQVPRGSPLPLYTQDQLIAELAGSAVAGDIESMILQVYYEDIGGANARLMTWDALKNRIKNMLTVRLAMTIGSTVGYNGAKAINADTDLLKAYTDYALLGITTDIDTAAITMRGPDTANLRVAVPGEASLTHLTNSWFKNLSMDTGFPLIPIINSANKGGTQFEVVGDENAGTANITIHLAELGT